MSVGELLLLARNIFGLAKGRPAAIVFAERTGDEQLLNLKGRDTINVMLL